MNIASKKFGRLQQWGKEKMGGDLKGGPTDEVKALEQEMNTRHDGLEKMHSSMTGYVKHLNKRSDGDARDKSTAIAHLGSAMSRHGEVFEDGNRFGECLMSFGMANERIARFQETYAADATTTWLEALERSMAQMKDYQNARKRFESRRSAYDSSLAKVQKAKKDDYKAEDELRQQKARYEESTEDVYRRMQDIVEAEQDNSQDLYAFLEAELYYHDRAREVLLQLKRNWPVPLDASAGRLPRSRTNTLSRLPTNDPISEDELAPPAFPFRGARARTISGSSSPAPGTPLREMPGFDFNSRPGICRTATPEALSTRKVSSRAAMVDVSSLRSAASLRPTRSRQTSAVVDTFADHQVEDDYSAQYSDRDALTRSSSPATSISQTSRSSIAVLPFGDGPAQNLAKKPPPPPPSRASKPPPPPPPMKRSALSSTPIPYT